jgi:saccharopine dehydrogenase-like NADP-dependent oxidoreductase
LGARRELCLSSYFARRSLAILAAEEILLFYYSLSLLPTFFLYHLFGLFFIFSLLSRFASLLLQETERLDKLISTHDLVVSLVPAPCHPPIARMCIAHGKHMVTASYVAEDMKALHEAASKAHITILNEAGLDPGMDHMSAMKLIDDARAAGGIITKFSSVCGGLPAPEASNNPLGYKFSWSPRGALIATRNNARYLSDGKTVEVPGEALLTSAVPFRVNPAFALECIPNRDSIPYASKYGIDGPQLKTMFRGTLRYRGFCGSMHALTALGFFDVDEKQTLRGISLRGLLAQFAGLIKVEAGLTAADTYAQAAGITDDQLFSAVLSVAASKASSLVAAQVERLTALSPAMGEAAKAGASACTNVTIASDPLKQAELRQFFEWCGLFSNNQVAPLRGGSSGDGINTPKTEVAVADEIAAGTFFSTPASAPILSFVPIDTLVALLTGKPEMSYEKGERDMALMQHDVEVHFPAQTVTMTADDGSVITTAMPERTERHTSTLVEYADLAKNRTAMARTVGFTAAIGAQLILDGKVGSTGVVVPMLEALEGEGITFKHTIKTL